MTGKDDNAENLEKSPITNKELLNSVADRRSFISRAAGAIGVAATLPGLSSARDNATERSPAQKRRLIELAREYMSTNAVRDAVQKHASEVLKTLHEEHYLENASVEDLSISEPIAAHELDTTDGVGVVGAIQDGTPTAWIEIRQTVDEEQILIVVLPQLNRSYAVLREPSSQTALGTVSFDGEYSDLNDDASSMVEGHECCEYRMSPEGYEYCQHLTALCYGESTPEGCEKNILDESCYVNCSSCTSDCCLDKCGYH